MPTLDVQLSIPQTTSEVPTLCSVHAEEGRGDYGDPAYRGNCSGLLIRDLLTYFKPRNLLDPMEGSGTAGDVARTLNIPYQGFDLKDGFDATNPRSFDGLGAFDMIWLHPPYHNLITYSNDSRCLSACSTLEEFLQKLKALLTNCIQALTDNGHIAILIGDITRKGHYYALPFHTWNVATELGLELASPEIVRLSHGASSTSNIYHFSFIPRVHDVCFVFRVKNHKY